MNTHLSAEDFLDDEFSADGFVINARRALSLEQLRASLGTTRSSLHSVVSAIKAREITRTSDN